jgi:hypothetical protein
MHILSRLFLGQNKKPTASIWRKICHPSAKRSSWSFISLVSRERKTATICETNSVMDLVCRDILTTVGSLFLSVEKTNR